MFGLSSMYEKLHASVHKELLPQAQLEQLLSFIKQRNAEQAKAHAPRFSEVQR